MTELLSFVPFAILLIVTTSSTSGIVVAGYDGVLGYDVVDGGSSSSSSSVVDLSYGGLSREDDEEYVEPSPPSTGDDNGDLTEEDVVASSDVVDEDAVDALDVTDTAAEDDVDGATAVVEEDVGSDVFDVDDNDADANDEEGTVVAMESDVADGSVGSGDDQSDVASPDDGGDNAESVVADASTFGELTATTATSSSIVSVPISPPVALQFRCSPIEEDEYSTLLSTSGALPSVPCGVGQSVSPDADLKVVEAAAEKYILQNQMLEMALIFDLEGENNADAIEFAGLDLVAAVSGQRGRWLQGMEKYLRARRLDDASPIVLSGAVDFAIPSSLSDEYDDDVTSLLPSESDLSELLLTVLVEEEAGIVEEIIRSTADDGGWLARVVGYRASFEGVDNDSLANHSVETGNDVSGQDAPSDNNVGDEEKSTLVSSANGSVDNAAAGGNGNKSNILLIVGSAGAALSLALLIGGLCYAKRSYDKKEGGKKKSKSTSNNGKCGEQVVFQPGKNNPRSPTATPSSLSLFGKKSSKGATGVGLSGSSTPQPPPMPSAKGGAGPTGPGDDVDSDDEDFLLARATLDRQAAKRARDGAGEDVGSVADSSRADLTFGDDMSYAFTVEGESLAPMGNGGGARGRASSTGDVSGDAAIGAGGMASFANDKGTFRWNEDGTKMVYTPNIAKPGDGGGVTAAGAEMNGFVWDNTNKKWVVKERVVGEKNVSFQAGSSPQKDTLRQETSLTRTRSSDSAGTGFTGLTNFSYDDIALDQAKRSRSGNSFANWSSMSPEHSGFEGGGEGSSFSDFSIPPSPSTPHEQGVEVPYDASIRPSGSHDDSEFFMLNTPVSHFTRSPGDDDSTAYSGFSSLAVQGPPQPPAPRPVTPEVTPERVPERTSSRVSVASSAAEPGRIVPKKRETGPNRMKIAEDAPFDEDIPFDERTRSTQGRGGGGGMSSTGKRGSPAIFIPDVLEGHDDGSQSDGSHGSGSSERVLEDLDKLSRFMMERKRSSKSQRSSNSEASSRSTRKRRNKSGAGPGARVLVASGVNLRSNNQSDPNRGL